MYLCESHFMRIAFSADDNVWFLFYRSKHNGVYSIYYGKLLFNDKKMSESLQMFKRLDMIYVLLHFIEGWISEKNNFSTYTIVCSPQTNERNSIKITQSNYTVCRWPHDLKYKITDPASRRNHVNHEYWNIAGIVMKWPYSIMTQQCSRETKISFLG